MFLVTLYLPSNVETFGSKRPEGLYTLFSHVKKYFFPGFCCVALKGVYSMTLGCRKPLSTSFVTVCAVLESG